MVLRSVLYYASESKSRHVAFCLSTGTKQIDDIEQMLRGSHSFVYVSFNDSTLMTSIRPNLRLHNRNSNDAEFKQMLALLCRSSDQRRKPSLFGEVGIRWSSRVRARSRHYVPHRDLPGGALISEKQNQASEKSLVLRKLENRL